MTMLVLGAIFLGGAASLDTFFRFRMIQAGRNSVFFEGGCFDYRNYRKVRAQRGWAAWPVNLMWALYLSGIALLIAGFFARFGSYPTP